MYILQYVSTPGLPPAEKKDAYIEFPFEKLPVATCSKKKLPVVYVSEPVGSALPGSAFGSYGNPSTLPNFPFRFLKFLGILYGSCCVYYN